MTQKHFFVLAILAVAMLSAGCETVKGVGRDITGASTTLQEQMSGGREKPSKF